MPEAASFGHRISRICAAMPAGDTFQGLPLERSDMEGARLILRTLTGAGFAVVEVP